MYYSWLKKCIREIRKDIPIISEAAEKAADRFVKDGFEIGAWGDPAFVSEFTARAGGVMPVVEKLEQSADKTIVLMTLRDSLLSSDLEKAKEWLEQGNEAIVFARASLIDAAKSSGLSTSFIENHAAEHGGLMELDANRAIPTDCTANIAALWTWTAEFIGACTRLGSAPPVWQSVMVPGSKERNEIYSGKRSLDNCPPPSPKGKIGRDYIDAVEANLDEVFSMEKENMMKAAELARRSHERGGKLYAAFMGHALQSQLGCDYDPGTFEAIGDAQMTENDFVLSVGYDRVLSGEELGDVAERTRDAGASIVWSFASYNPDEVKSIKPNEIYIDQRWEIGDAAVEIPGYDVRALPPSGVIGEAIFWTINAELLQML